MRRTIASLFGVATLALGPSLAAQTVDFGTICGVEGGHTVCANASAQLFAGYMEVYVQNAEGPADVGSAHRITGFGLYYFGASMGSAGTLGGTVPGGGWQNGFVGGGGALDNPGPVGTERWLLAATVRGNGGTWGCTDVTGNGADVSTCAGPLTFRFNGIDADQVRLADLEFAFRSQSIAGGDGSLKCYPTDPSTSDHACSPVLVTPEPATAALLALGLVGVGGVALRRRRQ